MKITIVIPAFNEEERIGKVLTDLNKYSYNILVVNDGSSDNTAKVVRKFRSIKLINQKSNSGQGSALRRGIREALKDKSDVIVTFDADGQHNSRDIKKFVTKISKGYDVALGSRFLKKTKLPLKRRILLKGSIFVERILLGIKLTDAHNGFRAFSAKAARKIKIKENGMAHASEIVYRIRENGLKYIEIPVAVRYTDETVAKGGNTILRSLKVLQKLIKLRFSAQS